MKVQDYSIVEKLRKTPTQISLLSLLIHSDEHRRVLMKILNEAHIPDKVTVNHLEKIAGKIFEASRITFSDEELPMEGTEHNRALYLTVKCKDSVISRVLVDNDSSANICPLSTLQKLKIGTERIHLNSVCVRGFDEGGKDFVGDIMLELSIGPVEFTMEFQVLDGAVSYNLLLSRPWIHAAKAVPSSLHQMVKFEWDRQEIVVHGDEDLSACNDIIVSFIEAKDDKGPWVYQTFETMSIEKIPEGKCIPGPKLSSASVMVANEMLKNGFVPGKGAEKPPTSSIPKPVVDVDEEIIKKFQSLFEEVNMVEVGEGSSKADVQLVGPNVKLSNWEAIPLPTRKEFCSFYAGCSDMTCMKNFQPNLKSQSNPEITIQEVEYDDEIEYDEEATFEKISKELKQFEEKPKPNLSETEAINLGDQDDVRETKISVHLEPQVKDEIIKHSFPHVKQKLRKFKTNMSVKIKEEITKQLTAKNVGAVYMRAMTIIFHGMIHREIEVYVDDVIIKSKKQSDHVKDLRKFFQRLRRYNLKLNPAKCAFGVPSEKLLGFVLLKKNVAVKWTDECQEAFDKIKRYLSNPPMLVPPEPGRPLILYLTVLNNSFGCILGQHDITGKKEQEIYYLSKKFTPNDVKYTLL
ncbi:uncharacterized protein [Nicotiana sylvestris]|uniref:uncharacterized protein n=1 Tax=Nicotiana sylvestris TaxID=4096 RepID=UPI00388CBAAF